MPISEADALKLHEAIHAGKPSVKVSSGETLKAEANANKCRLFKLSGVQAVEQNVKKPSAWSEQAKAGAKITWFISAAGGPPGWGRIVDGVVEKPGVSIEADVKAKAKATAKAEPKADAKAKAAPKQKAKAAPAPAEPKAKSKAAEEAEGAPSVKAAKVSGTASSSGSAGDPLGLAALFAGKGYGSDWEKILRPVIERQPQAASFIGPGRDRRIVPVRELTFQALKPNPPSGWRVLSFGQSPYPSLERATGIAHFDSLVDSWESSRFGSCLSMRLIIKTAAMRKYGILKATSTADLRTLLKGKNVVGPSEWFQAMLTQGVLFMNAACTLNPPEDKSIRAGSVVEAHTKFWTPVIEAVVDSILAECAKNKTGIVFAWLGGESLKTRKMLEKSCLAKYPSVLVKHIDHKNPAAMGDTFCDDPNVFGKINDAIKELGLGQAIDWLPSEGWLGKLRKTGSGSLEAKAQAMGSFISETKDLLKMYLERLADGLDTRGDQLSDISGVMKQPLLSLAKSCEALGLAAAANTSVDKAKTMDAGKLSRDEAAAVHFYTTNHLYKLLNAALRDENREDVKKYFLYLRLFLHALNKLPKAEKELYRGVDVDLSAQYPVGSEITWWAVSSCTPDRKVADSFSGGGGKGKKSTLFLLETHSGVAIKHLSEFKGEEEYILAPGTQFKVVDVEQGPSAVRIRMQQLRRPLRVQ